GFFVAKYASSLENLRNIFVACCHYGSIRVVLGSKGLKKRCTHAGSLSTKPGTHVAGVPLAIIWKEWSADIIADSYNVIKKAPPARIVHLFAPFPYGLGWETSYYMRVWISVCNAD
ncbi:MAG: hypothetical protein K9M54_09240, partial [Kiritimatiellales bacterium]|nr:hypothetical protein [Kiritimatiellales bacterium]